VSVYVINPVTDPRWDELATRHPKASAFHQTGWLRALESTYGYELVGLTSAIPGAELRDGLVFAKVASWVTGTRLVSLPFSDHCEPLVRTASEAGEFGQWLTREANKQRWRYVEIRPLEPNADYGWEPASSFCFHSLDLTPRSEDIFRALHKNSIQRKVRRAEREELTYEVGRSPQLLREFYWLVVITRRRQRLLPQPRSWFANLVECMGARCQIRVARWNGVAVAAIFTLEHGKSTIYKYGCSDERFHYLGGMPFLFWKLIEESKAAGMTDIDFGRSDLDNQGLIAFKNKFGASRKHLSYYRYSTDPRDARSWDIPGVKKMFSILPGWALSAGGSLAYRHLG
jgi:CelD/BcsL family acetyltransferase involved in cellulose biosynthesis